MSRRKVKPTMSTTTVQMPDGTTQEAQVARFDESATTAEPIAIGAGSPPGEAYPAIADSALTEEEHKLKEAAEADVREKRANAVKGPRKLKPNEIKVVKFFLDTYVAEDEPVDRVVSFTELHTDMKPWFQPSMKDNVIGRGIFDAIYDDETKMLVGTKLSAIGADLYFSLVRKGQDKVTGEPKSPGRVARTAAAKGEAAVTRNTKYPDNLKLRKLAVDNPRQVNSHGFHAYNMYEDGMTYNEYLKKAYDTSLTSGGAGTPFSGPKRVHWDWDLLHGFIGLYYADVPEFLEDGSPNPKFWFVNTSKPSEEVTTNSEEVTNTDTVTTETPATE